MRMSVRAARRQISVGETEIIEIIECRRYKKAFSDYAIKQQLPTFGKHMQDLVTRVLGRSREGERMLNLGRKDEGRST